MKKCITENCGRLFSEKSQFDDCPNCRASIGSWRKRSPADVLQRRKNLAMYADRMSNVSVDKNVVVFKKRARR
jgi:hypothetical protein